MMEMLNFVTVITFNVFLFKNKAYLMDWRDGSDGRLSSIPRTHVKDRTTTTKKKLVVVAYSLIIPALVIWRQTDPMGSVSN